MYFSMFIKPLNFCGTNGIMGLVKQGARGFL
jgi:hypothetical protein